MLAYPLPVTRYPTHLPRPCDAGDQAHKLSRRPPPRPPTAPKLQTWDKQDSEGGDATFSPLVVATSASNAPGVPGRGGSGVHSRSRSDSGFSSDSFEETLLRSAGAGAFAGAGANASAGVSSREGAGLERGLPRGREVRRLAKKMGSLMRDYSPSSSLEAFQVEEARLRLWVRRMLFPPPPRLTCGKGGDAHRCVCWHL